MVTLSTPNIKVTEGHQGSDCTRPYYIDLEKELTVGEFINEWIADNPTEWGSFLVTTCEDNPFAGIRIDYKYGALTDEPFPPKVLHALIAKAKGYGGYTLSDITLIVKELVFY